MVYESRKDIDDKYKWDLSDIIESDKRVEEIFEEIGKEYKEIANYRGTLGDPDMLIKCLKAESLVSEKLSRLYVYSKMHLDEDAKVTKCKAMTSRAESLAVEVSSALSFIVPEIVSSYDAEEILKLSREKEFSDFSYMLELIAKKKEHYLSDKEERILAEVGAFSGMFEDAFRMFDSVDVSFKRVIKDGKEIEMSHGEYSVLLQDSDRKVRKDAFESMFGAFKNMINTIAVLYAGNVKKDCFYAKIRNYPSAMEASVASEDVTIDVYNNLIKSVHDALPTLHGYMDLRRKALGVDKLHMYDMHVSIVEGDNIAVSYEEAKEIVKKALCPLGEEYGKLLDKAFNEGWIDVFESKGKRSGAYSWGTYSSHPYVLLNYQKTTHDVFTIAHELGHAMHSYYSNSTLPYEKAGYEIFVAEVASTVNEVLLLKYLMKERPEMKKFLLSYFLDMFRTTLFRQTQFAEFEKIAHEMEERGESLTPESLSDAYYKLNAEYYGDGVENDELIRYEWARIPHFYSSFYVYKYATGIISAVAIADSILSGNGDAVKNYKRFLSAGGSMSPVEILKLAGVDLTCEDAFNRAMNVMRDTLNELQKLG